MEETPQWWNLMVDQEMDIGKGLKKMMLKEGEGCYYPDSDDEVEGMYVVLIFDRCLLRSC